MADDKTNITQEEVNNLNISEKISLPEDIKNYIVLIRNELNTLDNQIVNFPEKDQKKIRKRLNKILMDIIDIRKL